MGDSRPVPRAGGENGRLCCAWQVSGTLSMVIWCPSVPHTNAFVERMNRTLLDECFRVKGRETFYLSIADKYVATPD